MIAPCALNSLALAAVPVGDRLDRGDPGDHRHRAVVALPPGGRARLRPPARRLSAHAGRRSRDAGRAADKFPQSLGEPLFELPLSGWYWQIDARSTADKPEVRASRSLWDGKLPQLEDQGVELGRRPASARAMSTARRASGCGWSSAPVDLGADGRFLVAVAGDATEIVEETRTFDYYLGGTFVGAGDRCCC